MEEVVVADRVTQKIVMVIAADVAGQGHGIGHDETEIVAERGGRETRGELEMRDARRSRWKGSRENGRIGKRSE